MKYDAASERRKQLFAASLKRLMLEKPLSKITINELVSDCGVNRKTFYYHFEDIYTLLKWMLEQEAIEVVKNFDVLLRPEDAVAFVFDYVTENQHILKCAYDSVGREEMRRFFYADFIDVISGVIDYAEGEANVRVDQPFKQFLADFYTEALAGLMINTFKGSVRYEREEILQNVILIFKETIPNALIARAAGHR